MYIIINIFPLILKDTWPIFLMVLQLHSLYPLPCSALPETDLYPCQRWLPWKIWLGVYPHDPFPSRTPLAGCPSVKGDSSCEVALSIRLPTSVLASTLPLASLDLEVVTLFHCGWPLCSACALLGSPNPLLDLSKHALCSAFFRQSGLKVSSASCWDPGCYVSLV